VADVVREERDALARLTQRRERLVGALGELVADPQAAVEIDEQVVVGPSDPRERHGG
jgi:hypothetical protein